MYNNLPYHLLSLDDNKYLVIGNDYRRLDDYKNTLNQDLSRQKFKGSIIFDLLLTNGFDCRFFEAPFDGDKIVTNQLKSVDTPASKVLNKTTSYFKKNKHLLENSALNSLEKQMLLDKIK